jgi:hypothetical protein
MSSKLLLAVLAICCLGLTLPAVAQLDSSALHEKYGRPLINRETFHVGFDLIVDYGAGNQVCKLELPALMPTNEKILNAPAMKQRMYDFLAELVPSSLRGKELGQRTEVMGSVSLWSLEYENVTVSELQYANEPFRNTITVTFKGENCPRPTGQ